MIENWPLLALFVAINIAVASTGMLFRPGQWYKTLAKPAWTPPNWVFGPAWTILYAMMAYAGYRFAVDAPAGERALPLALYGLQLLLNGAWSALFFGARRIDWAMVDILALIAAIAATIALFLPISPVAGFLLIPYVLWVCFAVALNYSILKLNK